MPIYEYLCGDCGEFSALQPLAARADPRACPGCEMPAPRVLLTPPRLSAIDPGRRVAHETNERARNSPSTSGTVRAHGAGCACCKPGLPRRSAATAANGAKSFPTARPWMISH